MKTKEDPLCAYGHRGVRIGCGDEAVPHARPEIVLVDLTGASIGEEGRPSVTD